VEDVAQNVFLAVYRGMVAFRRKSKFSTWVYRIAYNQACTALRRRQSRRSREIEQHDDSRRISLLESFSDGSNSPEDTVLRGQVWKTVDKLPTQSRAVIELHYGRGLSYPEIAEALSLPLGTVKTHLHRARAILRELLLGDTIKAAG
jgi:RNA polymerase sigma-70 factor (ECF subfamily)